MMFSEWSAFFYFLFPLVLFSSSSRPLLVLIFLSSSSFFILILLSSSSFFHPPPPHHHHPSHPPFLILLSSSALAHSLLLPHCRPWMRAHPPARSQPRRSAPVLCRAEALQPSGAVAEHVQRVLHGLANALGRGPGQHELGQCPLCLLGGS